MNKKYFRLFEESVLVSGKTICAINNLLSGTIRNISKEEYTWLIQLESGTPICELNCSCEKREIYSFLDDLVRNDLGFYTDKSVYIDKNIPSTKWIDHAYVTPSINYETVFIVLSSECQQTCVSCEKNIIKGSNCIGCFKGKTQKKKLDIEHYKKLFQFLKDNGTNTLFFTGGDITIDSERNLRIIEMAYSVGLKKLFCFFGGNRTIPQDVIDNLNKFGVHKFYQIEINEKFIPENNKMLQSLKYDENSTAYFLTVGLFSTKQFNAVLDKIRKLMPLPSIHVDFLVNKNDITPQAEKEIHRLLPPSFVLYSMLTENNYCMKNRLTVFEDGTIGVCPRMEALGTLENLYSGEANTIFEKFWKLTNDKIQPCADCRYRYTCVGCKYTELVVSGSLDHVSTCHEIL